MREAIAAALDDAQSRNDPLRLCTLRLMAAAIKDRDLALRAEGRERLCDDGIAEILQRLLRQHEASAGELEAEGQAGRAAEQRRLAGIVGEFLPRGLDAGSMLDACQMAVAETGASGLRDIGRCMNALKQRHGAALDLATAGTMMRTLLR